jgi:hypothetical protein
MEDSFRSKKDFYKDIKIVNDHKVRIIRSDISQEALQSITSPSVIVPAGFSARRYSLLPSSVKYIIVEDYSESEEMIAGLCLTSASKLSFLLYQQAQFVLTLIRGILKKPLQSIRLTSVTPEIVAELNKMTTVQHVGLDKLPDTYNDLSGLTLNLQSLSSRHLPTAHALKYLPLGEVRTLKLPEWCFPLESILALAPKIERIIFRSSKRFPDEFEDVETILKYRHVRIIHKNKSETSIEEEVAVSWYIEAISNKSFSECLNRGLVFTPTNKRNGANFLHLRRFYELTNWKNLFLQHLEFFLSEPQRDHLLDLPMQEILKCIPTALPPEWIERYLIICLKANIVEVFKLVSVEYLNPSLYSKMNSYTDPSIVELLIQKGVVPPTKYIEDTAIRGHKAMYILLVQYGYSLSPEFVAKNPNKWETLLQVVTTFPIHRDMEGNNLYHLALKMPDHRLEILLTFDPSGQEMYEANSKGETPFNLATPKQKVKMIDRLTKLGFTVTFNKPINP